MTLTTAVQDAIIRLGQDLTLRGWDLGAALWAIHPETDGTVSLEKAGGDEFYTGPVVDLITALPPPPDEHAGYVVTFEAWISDTGLAEHAAESPDRVDVRYLLAALTTGTCIVLEHRRDRSKARITFNDRSSPPIGMGGLCDALRDKVCAPRPQSSGLWDVIRSIDPSLLTGAVVFFPIRGDQ